jgi:hypothetical protein
VRFGNGKNALRWKYRAGFTCECPMLPSGRTGKLHSDSRSGNTRNLPRKSKDRPRMNTARPPFEDRVEKIRAEIDAVGESILTFGELRALCPEIAVSAQWEEIAKVALTEKWAFTFFPNGDVRFAPL